MCIKVQLNFHHLRSRPLGITGVVFHKPGPCLVSLQQMFRRNTIRNISPGRKDVALCTADRQADQGIFAR
jgi:hypothetical protein